VEYQVRAARITDVERIVALVGSAAPTASASTLEGADLLRQLVYLPQASVIVAESLRTMVGVAVLALRPSIPAGGYVGTIDLLAVDQRHDAERVTGAAPRGAASTTAPADGAAPVAWERHGFRPAGPRIECRIRAGRASADQG
jgi:hypothetical protein